MSSGREPIFYEYKDFVGIARWADLEAIEDKKLATAHREGVDLYGYASFTNEGDRPVVRDIIERNFGGDMAKFDAAVVEVINGTKFVRKMQGREDEDLNDYEGDSAAEDGGTLGT